MTDDEARPRCPWCLQSNFTETPLEFEGALAAHAECARRFSDALSSTGRRDPSLVMSVMSFVEDYRNTDPKWGHRALRMLHGEEPVPPIDTGG